MPLRYLPSLGMYGNQPHEIHLMHVKSIKVSSPPMPLRCLPFLVSVKAERLPDFCNIRHPSDLLLFPRDCFIRWANKKFSEKGYLEEAFVEEMKARFIRGLRRSEAPKSFSFPILQSFHDNSWNYRVHLLNDSNQKFWDGNPLGSEIVSISRQNPNGSQCLRFRIDLPLYVSKGKKYLADLWLYKKEGVTEYTIVQVIQDSSQEVLQREIFNVVNQPKKEGWTRFYVSPLIERLSTNQLDLEVYSSSDIPIKLERNNNPFLIAYSDSKQKRSKRSAVVCGEKISSCCVKKMYISFNDFGWDKWILYPDGFYASTCVGSCSDSANNKYPNATRCRPNAYKPFRISYINEENSVSLSRIDDVTISECACK
ncbi:inhibin beta E chain [Nephila pilipes]|uniref:Inhibin beta E chain n=1 Tax=Nephila pilipes TaxID=299642 RepID=A0A8X6NE36_NEPPI|nr:inhibin beta E chain [Nephila pilipes]